MMVARHVCLPLSGFISSEKTSSQVNYSGPTNSEEIPPLVAGRNLVKRNLLKLEVEMTVGGRRFLRVQASFKGYKGRQISTTSSNKTMMLTPAYFKGDSNPKCSFTVPLKKFWTGFLTQTCKKIPEFQQLKFQIFFQNIQTINKHIQPKMMLKNLFFRKRAKYQKRYFWLKTMNQRTIIWRAITYLIYQMTRLVKAAQMTQIAIKHR